MISPRLLAALAIVILGLSPLSAFADGGGEPGHAGNVELAPPANNLRAQIDPVEEPAAAACDFSDLVGKTPDTVDKTRFGDRHVRTLKHDQMVTMEYMEGRINLLLDEKGIIVQVTCG